MSRLLRKTPESSHARNSGTFWFVAKEKLLTGPFSFEQLLAELAEGHLDPGDYCWRQGFQEWRPLCSVEDFGFQVKPYVVRAYPLVPVPSARAPSDAAGAKSSPTAQNNKAQTMAPANNAKTVKVRLEPTRRLQVGLWERVGMVVFSVIFAWTATWVALSEVETLFRGRYERHAVGRVLEFGDVSHVQGMTADIPHPPESSIREPASLGSEVSARKFWSFQQLGPILAAPGLEAFQNEAWAVSEIVQRPVSSPLGFPTVSHEWHVPSGHAVQWSGGLSGEVIFREAADPVYVQSYELHGTWSPSDAKTLNLRNYGHPGF